MSKTVDERIVQMQFDNAQFERNIQTSMSTLEKLKQSLNLNGAAKGLQDIDAAANKLNFSGLSNSVGAVAAKFSALQVMGVTALANITNSAVNAGKRIVSALTIDPIKTGFQEYETQINSVQTILANTQSKGTTLNDVNKALDTLNKYADKTIYNFTEMTRNIGTFTAAGIDLDTSVNAIQGIANLAAVSGSTSQQASTAMYQLSQALSSGTVKLQDWNSVVNAGMGGQVFQDALKETARVHGIAIDDMIKSEGSFRETLQKGWLTSDILTETLQKFTLTTEGLTDAQIKQNREMLKSKGYTDAQIDEIFKLGDTATQAATKVKTFTQLWDTLKEAAQSGWTQSWEIIVGDFEEAKALLTEVSDTIGAMIGASANARNEVLQGWKDLGGRTDLIESFRNIFQSIIGVAKPIKEAFTDIFPPITAKQLANFTKILKNLTSHLKVSDETALKIKRTFKGVFAFVDIGVEAFKALAKGAISIIKNFTGIGGSILDVTASIGDFLLGIRNSTIKADIFGKTIDNVAGFITKIINKIKEFGSSVDISFKSPSFTGLLGIFEGIWKMVMMIGSKVGDIFSSVGSGLSNLLGKGDIFEVINSGIFAGVLLTLKKFVGGLNHSLKNVDGFLSNVKGILGDVRQCLKSYQEQIKAKTLKEIAIAVGILAASLFVISTIDEASLNRALGGITVLFIELIGALSAFSRINTDFKNVSKSISLMIGMSVAILILSAALRTLSSLSWEGLAKGLIGVGVLMAELAIFLDKANFDKKITKTTFGIVILSTAMIILSKAVENFGNMEWEEIGKGLAAIAGLLIELGLFIKYAGKADKVKSTGLSMILLAASMKILASAMKDFAKMKWDEIGRGLTVMSGALAELVIALRFMPKNTLSLSVGLVAVASAMIILATAMSDFGRMNWDEIGRGLAVMGVALFELALGLNFMNGTLAGSAALLVAAAALAIITPTLKSLGGMSWDEIGRGLAILAGALILVGAAGYILAPVIPSILGLAGAFALLGIATFGIGVGLAAVAFALTSLAAAGTAGATAIVAALTVIITGILDLIPSIAKILGEAIVTFATVIGDYAPQIAEAILKLVSSVLQSLATYGPQIVDSLMVFLIGIMNSLADHMPTFISAAVNLIGEFLRGIVDALNGIDTGNLLKGVIAVGIMTGLMYALSGVAAITPAAMLGVLGLGAVIAELALVLAAIGGLAQIPGLEWLVKEGGDFMQAIGTAIGQFVGGIVGGVAQGITSSFPQIGTDLSNFMTNLKPFLEGAKTIDTSILENVKSLSEMILLLTAADVINSATSWLTGGSSMTEFANQLVPFGEAMKEFSNVVTGIDAEAVTASATAGKALAELAKNLPNSGGVAGFFAGENDLSIISTQLVPFGQNLKAYSEAVTGIDAGAITASATAAKSIAELAKNLPNSGGVAGFFAGENDLSTISYQLVPFGQNLKAYSDAVKDIDPSVITASATAAQSLAELANNLPNSGGVVSWFTGDNSIASFGAELVPFGENMKAYADAISGIDMQVITASATAASALAELENNLPNTGGMVSWFTGDNKLSTFGAELEPFGEYIKAYAEAIAGIDSNAVSASAIAASALAELYNKLQNSGGIFDLFTGKGDLETFGTQLEAFGKSLKKYSDSIVGVDSASINSSSEAAKALVDIYNALDENDGIFSLFKDETGLGDLGKQLEPFGKGLKLYSDAVAGVDSSTISASAMAAMSLVGLFNDIQESDALNYIINGEVSFDDFGKSAASLGKAIKGYSESVTGINISAVNNSAEAARKLVSVIKSMVGINYNNVDSFKKAVKSLGDTEVSAFIEAFQNSGSKLESAGGNMTAAVAIGIKSKQKLINSAGISIANELSKAISTKTSSLSLSGAGIIEGLLKGIESKQAVSANISGKLVSNIISSVKSKNATFKTLGVELMTNFNDGIKSKTQVLLTIMKNATTNAVTAINGYYGKFYTAGNHVVEGFSKGITAKTFAAEAAAKAMAEAALQAARETLAVNSPSKEFYKIGGYSGEGFVNALCDYEAVAYKSATGMAESAKRGLTTAMTKAMEYVDGDMDLQPTIRPVVDLSDVINSSKSISGMFNGTSSNIRAVSSFMNSRGQNGSNGDIISAIDKLRGDLSNLGNTYYTVEGVTYDDGSNIANAVAAIVREARIERRM